MISLWRNFKLIRGVAKFYKIPVFHTYLKQEEARIAVRKADGKTGFIQIGMVPTKRTLISFFHELGHHVHEHGTDCTGQFKTIDIERWAWQEAFRLMKVHGIELNTEDLQFICQCYASYAEHEYLTNFRLRVSATTKQPKYILEKTNELLLDYTKAQVEDWNG